MKKLSVILNTTLLICLMASMPLLVSCQLLPATAIIEKSMDYHDPDRSLIKKDISLHFTETRPDGADRKSTISFNIAKETFEMIKS